MPNIAAAVVDHVPAKRKVPLALLCNRLEALGTKGRKGAGDLPTLLDERRDRSHHVDSDLQRRLEKIALDACRWTLEVPRCRIPLRRHGFEAHSYEHHSTLPA